MVMPSRSSWRRTTAISRSSLITIRARRPRTENGDNLVMPGPRSFHDPQMVGGLCHHTTDLVQLSEPRKVEAGEIGVGSQRGVGFPENPELASRYRMCQTRCQEAMIVIRIDPHRALRRLVAMVGGRPLDGPDIRRPGA